jgi:TolB-like protein/class 3 adenylate cyclase
MASTRRLVAILAADVAGYSRLIGSDEEGTLHRLRSSRTEVIDPKIAEHHGRLVKTTGDGLLVEFGSVVDALRCAAEVQRNMAERNSGLTASERLDFRIGVHQGDIVVEDGDIFGDGVNVAARLEALADPGGICVSARVQEDVAGRLALTFEDLGEQSVKNIVRPIRAYALTAKAVAALPRAELPATPAPTKPQRSHPSRRWIAAIAVAVVLVIGGGSWWLLQSPKAPAPGTAAPRLSIVVLPFNNLSNDPEQQYFVDGVTEDLTTDLSRIAGSFVISRNTAFTYKGKSVDARQIGRELGVRYVLEGSVQRSGKQVRVNAQLIDAGTDAHLWAEQFERDIGDLFALQNEITGRIATALNRALVNVEAARPTEQPDVMDYIFRGWAERLKPISRERRDEEIALFEHALAIDPHSVEAQSFLVIALTGRVLDEWSPSAAADIARAEGLVGQALATSPNSLLPHLARAQVLRAQCNLSMQNQCDEAILEYETVLASDPNMLLALAGLAQCKFYTGSLEEVVPLAEKFILLSPRDPNIWYPYYEIGRTRLLQSRIDEAISWLEKARNADPAHPAPHVFLVSAYALKGETERAAAELAEYQKLRGWRANIARAKKSAMGLPKIRALSETTFFAGLRKAGVPEE